MTQRTCDVDTCDRPHRARGLCTTHYNQAHQPSRHREVEMRCTTCGDPILKQVANSRAARFCSLLCRDLHAFERTNGDPTRAAREGRARKYPPKPKTINAPKDLRSPLRRAVEACDYAATITAIQALTALTPDGCWIWQRQIRRGYAHTVIAGKLIPVHRLALEARLHAPLGTQAAHHTCATTQCVNPDHLQPVTATANTAEMLARTYMVDRIRTLEAALSALSPQHPALTEISLREVT